MQTQNRPRGRPKIVHSIAVTSIRLSLPIPLFTAIKAVAIRDKRSLTKQIEFILEQAVEKIPTEGETRGETGKLIPPNGTTPGKLPW